MANDKVFPKGIMAFTPNEKAPDFVLGTIIISPKDLVEWMKGEGAAHLKQSEKYGKQLKLTLSKTKKGTLSLEVDTYVPGSKKKDEDNPW